MDPPFLPFDPDEIVDKMKCEAVSQVCENVDSCDGVSSETCSDLKENMQKCKISKCPFYDKCCKSNMGIIIFIIVLSLIVVGVFVFMILKHKRKFVFNK